MTPRTARVVIGRAALDAILAAVRGAYPDECCGLLVGTSEDGRAIVSRAVAAANVASEPARRFDVDPGVLLATHRAARAEGTAVLGPYHSHPDGAAVPSPTDAARARDAGAAGEAWLIVPVANGVPGTPRAFVFDGESFAEAGLDIAPAS